MFAGVTPGCLGAPGMRDYMNLVRSALAPDMSDNGGDLNDGLSRSTERHDAGRRPVHLGIAR